MKCFTRIVVVGMFAALTAASGCAKKELVKKDTEVAPVAAKTVVAPSPVTTDRAPATAETVSAPAVTPEPVAKGSRAEVVATALDKVFFDFDSSTLSDSARSTLVKNADYLKHNPSTKLSIEGHCDERGSDEYNLALGERRAHAAENYLAALGISAGRLTVISYGKERPADSGHNEAAWTKNRRDEFFIAR